MRLLASLLILTVMASAQAQGTAEDYDRANKLYWKTKDKDFDLLVIPGADHGAAESSYGQRRRKDFFVRHLLGVEPRQPRSN